MQAIINQKRSRLFTAAIVATLSLGASLVHAGTTPYSTGFEADGTGDSAGQTYTSGASVVGQNSWTYEDGEASNGTATVVSGSGGSINTGSQALQLTTPGTSAGFYDVYNANLADHTGSTATVPGLALDPSLSGGVVNVSFAMNHETGLTGNGAGIDIFDSKDGLIASLFAVTNSTTGANDLEVYNDSSGPVTVSGEAGVGRADGGYATYHISLDFNAHTFTVFVDGNLTGETFNFDASQNLIGGIAFATDDASDTSSTAYFDDLSVVPEPASIGVITLGGLLLATRRPRRTLA